MSVLQINSQDAAVLLKTMVADKPAEVEWPGYVNACHQIAERQTERVEQALNRKRAQALRYLGNKARGYGDEYSKAEPRVFTPQFVSELGEANSIRRARRNPWLEAMLAAANQDETRKLSGSTGNILPFGPQLTVM